MATPNRYTETGNYQVTDLDVGSDPEYYGFMDQDGNWYIMERTVSTEAYRYVRGMNATDEYQAKWTGRAALSYVYFDVAF